MSIGNLSYHKRCIAETISRAPEGASASMIFATKEDFLVEILLEASSCDTEFDIAYTAYKKKLTSHPANDIEELFLSAKIALFCGWEMLYEGFSISDVQEFARQRLLSCSYVSNELLEVVFSYLQTCVDHIDAIDKSTSPAPYLMPSIKHEREILWKIIDSR